MESKDMESKDMENEGMENEGMENEGMERVSQNYQRLVCELKRDFLSNVNTNTEILPAEVALSWRRSHSQLNNLQNKNHAKAPEISEANRERTKQGISKYTVYTLGSLRALYESIDQCLKRLNAVVFYIDEDFYAFNKSGNPQLLAELKNINVRFGTHFSEESLGTSAVSLAMAGSGSAWVYGREHFHAALEKYVSYAVQTHGVRTGRYIYLLLFLPIEAYSDAIAAAIEYVSSTHNVVTGYRLFPEVTLTNQFINTYLRKEYTSFVAIDHNRKIVRTDGYFSEIFHTSMDNTVGASIESIIPELAKFIPQIEGQQEIYMEEVIFPAFQADNRSFFLSTTPLMQGEKWVGTALILKNKHHLAQQMRQVFNDDAPFTISSIVGESPVVMACKKLILRSADSPGNVLIMGESGTGKELIAQAVHNLSPRRNKAFVSLNCASIPKELIGSEMFGYEEGAFTGARKGGAPGKFELADGGTLFLDEIGDMPIDMQTVLLRVLEERMVTRLGGAKKIRVDARIIAATNKNLFDEVNQGQFRMDLYYRLNVIRLDAPPLRQRLDDLPLLVDSFLKELARQYHRQPMSISTECVKLFYQYSWPGNVRELRNLLERMVNSSNSLEIQPQHLPPDFFYSLKPLQSPFSQSLGFTVNKPGSNYIEDFEKQKIQHLMVKYLGNKSAVAKELGVSRRTLYARLNKYDL